MAKRKGQPKPAVTKKKIEVQRRRAVRPTVAVNTQARVSESLVERKRREDRQREQRGELEDL